MTVQELDSKFKNVIQEFQGDGMANIMFTIGSDANYYIRNRVTKTGTDAEGTKYRPYSTNPMLAGCSGFLNKSKCPAVSKGKRREMKWVTIERGGKNVHLYEIPGGYAEFRRLNNLQSGFVDFAFSNRMWNNIKVIDDRMSARQGQVVIKATTEDDAKKLEGNTKRRTDILKLSKSEIKDLSVTFDKMVEDIFKREGLI